MSGVRGGWWVDRDGRAHIIKVATPKIEPRSGPPRMVDPSGPRFVFTARRVSGEELDLWTIA